MSVSGKPGKKRISLVLVSGFLGSGKTSFLNNIFNTFPGVKFGIIINDFGSLGVDAAEIRPVAGTEVSELNNGQIFCSCLSGSFIKSVSAYADKDIDYLLVETSGLAKPSPLLEIMEAIKRINGDKFAYCGMISIVDAGTYLDISTVLKSVNEQIAYSDLVLLNKTDTVDSDKIQTVEMEIMSVNRKAEIVRTKYGRITGEQFLALHEKTELPLPNEDYAGWGGQGRPVPLLLKSDKKLPLSDIEAFVENPGGEYYRLKGTLESDAGRVFVDCTLNDKKIIREDDIRDKEEGLVIILPADDDVVKNVKGRAAEFFVSVG